MASRLLGTHVRWRAHDLFRLTPARHFAARAYALRPQDPKAKALYEHLRTSHRE